MSPFTRRASETERIDWILVKDLDEHIKVRSHQIPRDADEEAGLYPSDHYPALADLDLTE